MKTDYPQHMWKKPMPTKCCLNDIMMHSKFIFLLPDPAANDNPIIPFMLSVHPVRGSCQEFITKTIMEEVTEA